MRSLGPVLAGRRLRIPPWKAFWRLWVRRWATDQLSTSAGYLAYVTMISLVPLAAVMVSVLSFFPFFDRTRESIEAFVFSNFVPAAGDVIRDYLLSFVSNARQMTTVGLVFLVLTSLLLFSNIDTTINRLWHNRKPRGILASVALYWLVLTLGPLLIGASIAITSYALGMSLAQDAGLRRPMAMVLEYLPALFSFAGIFLLYTMVPNTRVRVRDAAVGALVATILFEGGKVVFSIWVSRFPTWQTMYGALSVVPMLLVWIYFSWFFVLLGAFLASLLGDLARLGPASLESAGAPDRLDPPGQGPRRPRPWQRRRRKRREGPPRRLFQPSPR